LYDFVSGALRPLPSTFLLAGRQTDPVWCVCLLLIEVVLYLLAVLCRSDGGESAAPTDALRYSVRIRLLNLAEVVELLDDHGLVNCGAGEPTAFGREGIYPALALGCILVNVPGETVLGEARRQISALLGAREQLVALLAVSVELSVAVLSLPLSFNALAFK